MQNKSWITRIFILAGLVNFLGIPLFSKFFTNDLLMRIDAGTFSPVGLGGIMLWGLAYIALSRHYMQAPFVSAVFALEKFYYTIVWILWLSAHAGELPSIYRQDMITGFFYSIYGINDFLFGVFFLYVFAVARKTPAATAVKA